MQSQEYSGYNSTQPHGGDFDSNFPTLGGGNVTKTANKRPSPEQRRASNDFQPQSDGWDSYPINNDTNFDMNRTQQSNYDDKWNDYDQNQNQNQKYDRDQDRNQYRNQNQNQKYDRNQDQNRNQKYDQNKQDWVRKEPEPEKEAGPHKTDLGDLYTDEDFHIMEVSERNLKCYKKFDDIFEKFENANGRDYTDLLLRGIYAYGYEQPSPIQQKAIRPLLEGRDIIAQSQSGTGKTATFLIGMLGQIDLSQQTVQGIVIAPTRELAGQINKVLTNLISSQLAEQLKVELVIGGTQSRTRRYAFSGKTSNDKITSHIIICTPGRLVDCLKRGRIDTTHVKTLSLDEADDILSEGFMEQMSVIINYIPKEAQFAFFSATMPPELLEMIHEANIMNNPLKILINPDNVSLEGITQYYVDVVEDDKYAVLIDLCRRISFQQVMVFCNSKHKVENLTGSLMRENFPVARISGSMSQDDRNKVMDEFRKGEHRWLITTDMLARGIDVQQVSMVINYDFPKDIESYIHRIGRSGRYGRKGKAINFITDRDYPNQKRAEATYNVKVTALPQNVEDI